MDDYAIDFCHQQELLQVDELQLKNAIELVLSQEGVSHAEVRVAFVDDDCIHQANRQFLGHDQPTDVLSFPDNQQAGPLGGDIMVSTETAIRQSNHYGWSAQHELLLYIIHGVLHLIGYEDLDDDARKIMRDREIHYLKSLGIEALYDPEELSRHSL